MIQNKSRYFINLLNIILAVVSVYAVVSIIAEYGFYLSPNMENWMHRIDLFIVWYFVLQAVLKLILAENRWSYIKLRWFDYLLTLLILIETVFFIHFSFLEIFNPMTPGREVTSLTKFYIIGFQFFILISVLSNATRLNRGVASFKVHPAQVLLGSFLLIILLGTACLMLPRAVAAGNHLSWIDALFTATSATCVTGLIVVDTGTHFSLLGQVIILVLMQTGALGLMTFASFFTLIFRRKISLKEKSMLREMLNYENMGLIAKLLKSTVWVTFGIELFAAAILYIGLRDASIFSALFHSVSAFCNAGFSLYSDSFAGYQLNYLVMSTVSLLIIIGGLGFPVLMNIMSFRFYSPAASGRWLNVQSKLVLGISAFLLMLGFGGFFILENHHVLADFSLFGKLLNAFFQSVTARTAGFNTIDFGLISAPTLLLFLLLMFIGASPGSTGGGIKTTTVGVLFAGIVSIIRGRNRIELFKKNIPFAVLNRALVIILFSLLFIFTATFLINITENLPFMDLLFEVFSAFGTVGLSRGITAMLGPFGKSIIILTMFFGRLGALTISLAITSPKEIYHYDYPSENVMVG